MDRRIDPPGETELANFIELMVTPNPPMQPFPLFRTRQKLLMFAAALGKSENQRSQLRKRGEGIRYDVFQKALDDAFVDGLAVVESGDLHILAENREDDRAKVFEEYAQAGLERMLQIHRQGRSDPLLQYVELAMEQEARPDSDVDGGIVDIAKLFGI